MNSILTSRLWPIARWAGAAPRPATSCGSRVSRTSRICWAASRRGAIRSTRPSPNTKLVQCCARLPIAVALLPELVSPAPLTVFIALIPVGSFGNSRHAQVVRCLDRVHHGAAGVESGGHRIDADRSELLEAAVTAPAGWLAGRVPPVGVGIRGRGRAH